MPGSFNDFFGKPESILDLGHTAENFAKVLEDTKLALQKSGDIRVSKGVSVHQTPPTEAPPAAVVNEVMAAAALYIAIRKLKDWLRRIRGGNNGPGC